MVDLMKLRDLLPLATKGSFLREVLKVKKVCFLSCIRMYLLIIFSNFLFSGEQNEAQGIFRNRDWSKN